MGLSETLKAVSDPVRRQILQLLSHNSMNAGEIASHFSITGAAVSRHLSILKEAGLVRSWRKGKEIHYELNASVLDEIILWIEVLRRKEKTGDEKHEEPSQTPVADSH